MSDTSRLDAIEKAIENRDAEWAKELIRDCYGIDYLQSAWINRTQDPLFGRVGKIAPRKLAGSLGPHQFIRRGYEYLVGIESDL